MHEFTVLLIDQSGGWRLMSLHAVLVIEVSHRSEKFIACPLLLILNHLVVFRVDTTPRSQYFLKFILDLLG
jgi:hypothetical protein